MTDAASPDTGHEPTKEMTARELVEQCLEAMVEGESNVVHFKVPTQQAGNVWFALQLIGNEEDMKNYKQLMASVFSELAGDVVVDPKRLN